MSQGKLASIVGVIVSLFGLLSATQVITLLGPTAGAVWLVAGALVVAIAPSLSGSTLPHGFAWAGVAATGFGAITAANILPSLTSLVGEKGAAAIALLGLVAAAIAKGFGEPPLR